MPRAAATTTRLETREDTPTSVAAAALPSPAARARFLALAPWLLLALALALRLWALDLRPPHSDEGVNGWFSQRVLSEGYYHYDPENYHGPLHYYLLAIAQLLLGRNLWALRLPTVLFGVAAVWLAMRCEEGLGRRVAWTAALFLAVSPAMILYARWAIHESEFAFFSLLVLRGLLRWRARGDDLAVWQVGLGVAGALLTKEVWVVHAAALAGAWACALLTRRWARSGEEGVAAPAPHRPLPWTTVTLAFLFCLGATVLLYAGFGKDMDGIARFFAPFAIWSKRAMQGAGHEKPWYYWLTLFARYEPPAIVGLAAAPFAALLAARPMRTLAFYAGGSFVAYSVIHYKTPWCVLELVWPLAFVAAWGIWALGAHTREALGAVLVAGFALGSLVPAVRVNFFHYADPGQPYIYVQTFPTGLVPLHILEEAVRRNPKLHDGTIQVVMGLSWPLPWLLGDFPHVGHWNGDKLPPGDADVLFVDRPHKAQVEALLHDRYYRIPFVMSPVHPVSYAYFVAWRFVGTVPADAPVFVGTPAPSPTPAGAPTSAPPAPPPASTR
jgi:uncharacterized protein (TIGR03663 family)